MKIRFVVTLFLIYLAMATWRAPAAEPPKTIGVDLKLRNTAVKPGDDFPPGSARR
jgi:hypothetical protein